MHKCKKCGLVFENKGLLLLHYKEHKRGEADDDIDEVEVEEKTNSDNEVKNTSKKVIPIDYCPREVKLLSENQIVGLKILGMKKGNEIIINDIYLL